MARVCVRLKWFQPVCGHATAPTVDVRGMSAVLRCGMRSDVHQVEGSISSEFFKWTDRGVFDKGV